MQITNITPTARKENDKIRIAAYLSGVDRFARANSFVCGTDSAL